MVLLIGRRQKLVLGWNPSRVMILGMLWYWTTTNSSSLVVTGLVSVHSRARHHHHVPVWQDSASFRRCRKGGDMLVSHIAFVKRPFSRTTTCVQATETDRTDASSPTTGTFHQDTIRPQDEAASRRRSSCLACGLLFSSFSDGLKPTVQAHVVLQQGLLQSLLRQGQVQVEREIAQSATQSPCCGPTNLDAVQHLEQLDQAMQQLWSCSTVSSSVPRETAESIWKALLNKDMGNDDSHARLPSIRIVYIPTALYALRPDSTSTPGKQRQRARYDAKERRQALVQFLEPLVTDLLPLESASAPATLQLELVTVDLSDNSVKLPQQVPISRNPSKNDETPASSSNNNNKLPSWCPPSGHQALTDWHPHLIYVEGGNTFWLYHCLQEQQPTCFEALRQAVDATGSTAAVYCGSSAGAILLGASMQTACWKEWDAPSIVPTRPTYDDWKAVAGLDLLVPPGTSIFPHMTSQWHELVNRKVQELRRENDYDKTEPMTNDEQHDMIIPTSSTTGVICLRDEDVLCVVGGLDNAHDNNDGTAPLRLFSAPEVETEEPEP